MAFQTSRKAYEQIDPTFGYGYPYERTHHNVGQLQTPYRGKTFGQGGDYGPVQNTTRYTVDNPNSIYVMDKDFRATTYLPTEGCLFNRPGYYPARQEKYNERSVLPNHFG